MKWSSVEVKILKKLYPKNSKFEVLEGLPDRSWDSIKVRASFLKIKRKINERDSFWSKKEIRLLKTKYPSYSKRYLITKFTLRSWESIQRKASSLGIKREDCSWCSSQIKYLLENYNSLSKSTLEKNIGKKWTTIKARANKLNLTRAKTALWSISEIELLYRNYPSILKSELMILLSGRSWESIMAKSKKLKIKRSESIKQEQIFLTKCLNGTLGIKSSKIEIELHRYLCDFIDNTTIHLYRVGEFTVDFYIPKQEKVVELFGDFFHGKKYTIPQLEEINPPPNTKLYGVLRTMRRDLLRKNQIPNLVIIWESDLKYNIKENKVEEFLKEKII